MELTLDQALLKGIEAHKAGKAQEADRYYTAILKANPKHPDANHNMAVLAVGVGKVKEALPFFKTALEAKPTTTQYWLSYINALIKLDRMADAKAVLEQAKSNGAQGNCFDKIEKQLESFLSQNSNTQEPSQKELTNLISLYRQGQYQEILNQASQLLEQFPNSINLYNIIGVTNKGLGKLEDAIRAYKQAITIKPDYAEAYYNMGNAFQERGKLREAIEAFNKALLLKPDYPKAYYNMGNALKNQGKLEEAIGAYKKALATKPDYAEVYNNMGNALKAQGKLKEAVDASKKAIDLNSGYAEAYYNMGIALQEQGKLDEAIEAYNKALSIKPDYAEAYNNMGVTLTEQGKPEEAIEAYTKALAIKPDYAESWNNMGNVLKGIVFNKPNRDLQKTIVSLLYKKTYVSPKVIAKAAISLLKCDPNLQKHLHSENGNVIENPMDIISDLHEFPLLMKLMSVCPLPDLELEGLFTNLRCSILSNISSLKEASAEIIRFQSALALHCFTNEYIYNFTDEEEKVLRTLENTIRKAFKNNKQPSPQTVLALASYKALNQYDWCNLLVLTDEIKEVFIRQIEEPNQEEKLKQDLPILEEITDNTSSKVRAQYEESPYPRWVNLGLFIKPKSISNVVDEIKLKLHNNKINEVEKPDILIAGCGTGQHSIGTSARFKDSNILAIDLSLSSLVYAKRKTNELNIENIEYMQADILDLGKLNKQFDIIESAGVLHHMENPMAGWNVLKDCLKPGGLMRLGLYSDLARQHIVKIREEIKQRGIVSSVLDMKSFRDMIIRSEKDHHKLISNTIDFYSLSTLRDLLFHVQEHRFSVPMIKEHLDKLGLHFCGFEQKEIVSHFKQTNKAKDDPYDLDKWQAYEEANQSAFAGMYQFWCQKVD